jgi:tetratricopeptide (TPR) repeat protein
VAALNARIAELSRAGRYSEAIPLAQRLLANLEQAYSPSNRDVAASLNNLALPYGSQGSDAEAEPLYRRSLAIMEKVFGLESAEVGADLSNLAALYQRQERYADAEPLYQRAVAIRERALGSDHPDLWSSLNNLASLSQAEGRTPDALPLVERMIASGHEQLRVALQVLSAAPRQQLMPAEQALDDALNAVQRGAQSSAASAVNKLAVRLAAGNDRLAQLVRRDQDLATEAETLDKTIVRATSLR